MYTLAKTVHDLSLYTEVSTDEIIDALTGVCWDEEDAGSIREEIPEAEAEWEETKVWLKDIQENSPSLPKSDLKWKDLGE